MIIDPMIKGRASYRKLTPSGQALVDAAPRPAKLAQTAIDHMDGLGELEYNQRHWFSPCGTTACVAGAIGYSAGFRDAGHHFGYTVDGDSWSDVGEALVGGHRYGSCPIFDEFANADRIREVLQEIVFSDPDR